MVEEIICSLQTDYSFGGWITDINIIIILLFWHQPSHEQFEREVQPTCEGSSASWIYIYTYISPTMTQTRKTKNEYYGIELYVEK